MSHLLDRLLDYTPSIPGLTVIEPDTILKRNLAALEYERACKVEADHGADAMDSMGAWAAANQEIVR